MEPWEREYRTGRKRNETKRNETKRNETKRNDNKRNRTKANNDRQRAARRNGPPLVPTGQDGKRDEAARFVETI